MTLSATGKFNKVTLYQKKQQFLVQSLTLKGNGIAINCTIFQGDFLRLFGYRQFGDKHTKHYLQQQDAKHGAAQVCSI